MLRGVAASSCFRSVRHARTLLAPRCRYTPVLSLADTVHCIRQDKEVILTGNPYEDTAKRFPRVILLLC